MTERVPSAAQLAEEQVPGDAVSTPRLIFRDVPMSRVQEAVVAIKCLLEHHPNGVGGAIVGNRTLDRYYYVTWNRGGRSITVRPNHSGEAT